MFISEIDQVPDQLQKFENNGQMIFISGDCTSNKILDQARVQHAHYAILVAEQHIPGRSDQDRDARTILTALTIEKRNPHINTCVELLHKEEHKENILKMAQVETVISCDTYLGKLIAHSTRSHGRAETLAQLLCSNDGNEFKK